MDDLDRAADLEEHTRRVAMQRRRNEEGPRLTGACNWCEAEVFSGLKFCDFDCAADYKRQKLADSLAGRR